MERVGHLLKKLLRWAGFAVVFVAVLEVCARIDDRLTWGAPLRGHYSRRLLTVRDDLGIRGRPNGRFEKWQLNSLGFRGPEIEIEKPAGVIRVVVIGASEAFGLYESPGKEFPAQMQAMLDERHPGRYQVINAACAGMTLPRFISYFPAQIAPLKPDIVLIYPTPASYVATDAPTPKFDPPPGTPERLPEEFRIVRKAEVLLKRFVPVAVQHRLRERAIVRVVSQHDARWVWEDVPSERVGLFRQHLADLIAVIQAAGVRVILATHANRFPADRTAWTAADQVQMSAWRRFHPRASESCLLEMERAGNRVVGELAREFNLPVADVACAFDLEVERLASFWRFLGVDWMVPAKSAYFADFSHFTDEGARVVAAEITREILRLTLPTPDDF